VLYLLVNFVLVANVTPADARVVVDGDGSTTLGHVVARGLVGPGGAAAMSGLAVLAFLSAASAMTYAGPRIAAAMARDGWLPRGLGGAIDRPPRRAVALQGAIALIIVWAQGLQGALQTTGVLLVLFAAMACVALVHRAAWPAPGVAPPARVAVAAAAVYILAALGMFAVAVRDDPAVIAWCAAATVAALIGYRATRAAAAR
jgi:APA family basic amino acid/polyamine antiporter